MFFHPNYNMLVIGGEPLDLFKRLLMDRKEVATGSDVNTVNQGGPKGLYSILGPILLIMFIIFVNDFPANTNSHVLMRMIINSH